MKQALLMLICMASINLFSDMTPEWAALHAIYDPLIGRLKQSVNDTTDYAPDVVYDTFEASLGRGVFPECYRILEEEFANPVYVSFIIGRFWLIDGLNRETKGEERALEWTRKAVTSYANNFGQELGSQILENRVLEWLMSKAYMRNELGLETKEEMLEWTHKAVTGHGSISFNRGLEYLMFKGDAKDIELLRQYNAYPWADILEMRVAGANVFDDPRVDALRLGIRPNFIPSVTNTGPQALYVQEILCRYWEENGKDSSKIPPELLTMVVSFDDKGNLVSSVDLSKHGLSMPAITLKSGSHAVWQNSVYTVAFPDLAELVTMELSMDRKSLYHKDLYSPIPKKSPAPAE